MAAAITTPGVGRMSDVFENPFVREVMESQKRDIERLTFRAATLEGCIRGAFAGDEKAKEHLGRWLNTGRLPVEVEWLGTPTPEADAALEKLGIPKEGGGVLPDNFEDLLRAQGVKKIFEGDE
jgi:hypothetical protein